MKLYHFVLIYGIIAVMILSVTLTITKKAGNAAREEIRITDTLVNAGKMAAQQLRSEPKAITVEMVNSMYNDYLRTLAVELGCEGYGVADAELCRYIPVFAVFCPGGVWLNCISEGTEENRMTDGPYEINNSKELILLLNRAVASANRIGEAYGMKYSMNIEADAAAGRGFDPEGYGILALFQNFPERASGHTYDRAVMVGISVESRLLLKDSIESGVVTKIILNQ